MTPDEKAAVKYAKEYHEAIIKYGLDDIVDGHGQSTKRYMMDSFYSGFYAGRDYIREKYMKVIEDMCILEEFEKILYDKGKRDVDQEDNI